MAEPDDIGAKRFWGVARLAGLGLAVIFLLGVTGGFLAGHLEKHGEMTTTGMLVLAGIVIAVAGCVWLLVRELRKPSVEEPLTPRERLNRNIMFGCAVLGGIMGIAMAIGEGPHMLKSGGMFSNEPLPPALALALAAVMGILLPIVSIFWHRSVVDELEADAYKTGALYAIYVYMIGAPVWWVLWRGGFAPEPNGIIIYFAVITTLGAVWLRKKYG